MSEPLYMDMHRYDRLTLEQRRALDAWLDDEGLLSRSVVAFTVTGATVDIECHATDENGDLLIDGNEIVTRSERWPIRTPPPASIFAAARPPMEEHPRD